MNDKINELLERVEAFKPKAAAEIEDFRIRMLGKKGELTALMEEFKSVAPELKREFGQKLNNLKNRTQERINALLDAPYILVIVGAMLLLTAALLAFAYYAKPRQKETISYRDAFIIGLAQACAAMPGLSRSGTTIATGLLLGNKKAAVAQFSFLMVLAPILGETLLEAVSGDLTAGVAAGPLSAGFLASFVTGCLACKFMIEIVKRGKLIWFALYCAAAGLVSILSYIC